jgi:hypothetical protein
VWINDELSARSRWVAGLMLPPALGAVALLSIKPMGEVYKTAVRRRAGRG